MASHGYNHVLCKEQSANELKVDLVKSKELLEDITGCSIHGYRAPSFSIDQDIMNLVEGAGYLYDSSLNSFNLHRRYGQVKLSNNGKNGISVQLSEKFYELPISNLKIAKQMIPWGGGGYFRLMPLSIFRQGVEKLLERHGAYLFYLHPWEVDPGQPRVERIPRSFKFRHYANLDKTYAKLSMLFNSLKAYSFSTCFQYISPVTPVSQ